MSRLIRISLAGAEITADEWTPLADDAPLPAGEKCIISLARWREERAGPEGERLEVGVQVANSEDILTSWPELRGRPLVALEFPTAGDGRAYSQARLLRERCGFRGQLRAVGDVLRDQLQFMHRCGFDALVPRPDQNLDACVRAFGDFSRVYQQPDTGLPNVRALRGA